MEEGTKPLKITVVGDGSVGKTCLLWSFIKGTFRVEYTPTVFEKYMMKMDMDGVEYAVELWDTAGQEGYDKLRPLSYPETDCFIICYAVNNPSSLANITNIWIPELRQHCPRTPIVLAGTKVDYRDEESEEVASTTTTNKCTLVTEKQGRSVRSKIKARNLIECSALTRVGIEQTFHEAVQAAIRYRKDQTERKLCKIL